MRDGEIRLCFFFFNCMFTVVRGIRCEGLGFVFGSGDLFRRGRFYLGLVDFFYIDIIFVEFKMFIFFLISNFFLI